MSARYERGGDIVRAELPEPKLRAPGSHRRKEHVGTRGHEDQDGRGWRLLEGLEQRVLRGRYQRVRLVNDDDPATSFKWAIGHAIDDLSDLFDLDRSGVAGLDEENIGENTAANTQAGRADAAGVDFYVRAMNRSGAIERLRGAESDEPLADA